MRMTFAHSPCWMDLRMGTSNVCSRFATSPVPTVSSRAGLRSGFSMVLRSDRASRLVHKCQGDYVGHLLSAALRQASLLAVQHGGRLPRVCRAREQARGSADPDLGSAVRDFGVRPAVLSCTSWAPPVIVGLDSRDTPGPKVRARSGGRLLKATSRRPKSEVCATHYRLSLASGTTTACRARKGDSSRCRTPRRFAHPRAQYMAAP